MRLAGLLSDRPAKSQTTEVYHVRVLVWHAWREFSSENVQI